MKLSGEFTLMDPVTGKPSVYNDAVAVITEPSALFVPGIHRSFVTIYADDSKRDVIYATDIFSEGGDDEAVLNTARTQYAPLMIVTE